MAEPKRASTAVFRISVLIASFFVAWGIVAPAHLAATSSALLAYVNKSFGWFYLTSVFGFLVFSLYLALGPFARMKLGRPDDDPDYPYFTWLAMLFSAGMGIGLVFWGVAEPLSHYAKPPPFVAAGDPAGWTRPAHTSISAATKAFSLRW